MDNTYDVIIIGGGVGGLATGLTLARARRRVLIVDLGLPRNRFAYHMHSFLGQEGTNPLDLLRKGRDEVRVFGAEIVDAEVSGVSYDGGFTVELQGRTVTARALVLATGVTDELPDVPGLRERWGIDVIHCPYCHGYEFGGQRLGVLITSPMGLHVAKLVRQWSDDVTLFVADGQEIPADEQVAFAARGMKVVKGGVQGVVVVDDALTAVRTAEGEVPLDALFVTPASRPNDELVQGFDLERTEYPMGSFLKVDAMGKTSHPWIWAVGNVTNPGMNVAMTVGAAASVGGMLNAALVEQDFTQALTHSHHSPLPPAEYWEARYGERDQVWSGKVNAVLAGIASDLEPGRALDLGCGEGGDVIWLAEQGWKAVGIDISPTATSRGEAAAKERGLDDRATFFAQDLADADLDGKFDLVTASFFQSPVELDRAAALRRAAALLRPGGHLLITAHAAPPPWANPEHLKTFRPIDPHDEVAMLQLEPGEWETVFAEIRTRTATSPDGVPGELEDSVVLLRRL
ncbi:FAD-dependent oxidoreductase [Tessaracoccus caeni]|uniref:FAD-dependent oxidoreductase n=1 Tax=Tessaracoccus caeni TaxID=3031239 RepID=UPI0023DB6F9C|nr:FAD-dependent oxidoreductase [Tessaracoccus caeni]MDF1489995.1 FAD-dependent oxidoreductase [Tessaracoccus caeni]